MEGQEQKIEVHVHDGGQLNIALDNAKIEAVQNNGGWYEEKNSNTFLDVIDGKEYIHKIYENGKEKCRIATEDDVKNIPNEKIEEYKKQLGTRLNGNESKLQIISMLLQEMDNTLQTGKRYGVMPMFSYIPRGVVKGYLYLDDCVMPYDNIKVDMFYWDAYEKYIIDTKYYHFLLLLFNGTVVYFELGYNLSFSDVTERLYGFGKVKALQDARKITVFLQESNRRIPVEISLFDKNDIEEQIAITDYWIEQMEMIDEIESYFKIKFHLPKKATEQDYHVIYVLYNAINKLVTSTFPALPDEKPFFRKTVRLDEEILINHGENFPHMDLFGYHFEPVAAYIMKCTLIWKKRIKGWEVKEGGVPVRVEFICYRE